MSEPTGEESEQQAIPPVAPEPLNPPTAPAIDTESLLRYIKARQAEAEAKAEKAASEAERRQAETLSAITKQGKVSLSIAAIVAICTVGQWITTCSNNSGTTAQTNKLICAAKINAGASNRIAAASEESSKAAGNFADTASDIHDSLDAAVGKLSDQVHASSAALYLEERPWVGLSPVGSVQTRHEGSLPFAQDAIASVENSGRVPALQVSITAGSYFQVKPFYKPTDKDQIFIQKLVDGGQQGIFRGMMAETGRPADDGIDVISPAALSALPVPEGVAIVMLPIRNSLGVLAPGIFYPLQLNKDAAVSGTIIIYGRVEYSDPLNKHTQHITTFCAYRPDHRDGKFLPCSFYNHMD